MAASVAANAVRIRGAPSGQPASTARSAQVVGEYLGGKVLLQDEIGEPRNRFERQPVLDPLESFLDAPALVIERAQTVRREMPGRRADWSSALARAHSE
jgi:hypothetical protein